MLHIISSPRLAVAAAAVLTGEGWGLPGGEGPSDEVLYFMVGGGEGGGRQRR